MKLEIFPVYDRDTHGQLFPSCWSIARGYHVYKDDWNPNIGDLLK